MLQIDLGKGKVLGLQWRHIVEEDELVTSIRAQCFTPNSGKTFTEMNQVYLDVVISKDLSMKGRFDNATTLLNRAYQKFNLSVNEIKLIAAKYYRPQELRRQSYRKMITVNGELPEVKSNHWTNDVISKKERRVLK